MENSSRSFDFEPFGLYSIVYDKLEKKERTADMALAALASLNVPLSQRIVCTFWHAGFFWLSLEGLQIPTCFFNQW